MRRFLAGNTLVEYTLIGVIVTSICIAGVVYLANGAKTGMNLIKSDMQKHGNAASQTSQIPINTGGLNPPSDNGNHLSPGLPVSGAPDSLTQTPAAQSFTSNREMVKNFVETAGANGMTELLANELTQKIDQWLKNGKITQSDANILRDLANQSHRLAGAEKVMEQAYINGQDPVSFEGKTYTLNEFANSKVWLDFGMSFQKAMGSSAFKNETVSQDVSRLVVQIGAVDDALQRSITTLASNPSSTASERSNELSNSITSKIVDNHDKISKDFVGMEDFASSYNHTASGDICNQSGVNLDTGQQCVAR